MRAKVATGALTAILMLTAACAMPARVGSMAPDVSPSAGAPASGLANGIGVIVVDGGKPTLPFLNSEVGNDAFAAAIRNALAEGGFWTTDTGAARYAMHASLVRNDRPVRGLSKSARSVVRYRLQELASRRIVFDERIESVHTVSFDDTPIASLRERRANEGAIRKNLAALIARLRELPVAARAG